VKNIFLLVVLFFGINLFSNEINTENFKIIKLISVYDGDTFRADINCSNDFFCKNVSIRVYGIDTPEKRGNSNLEKVLARLAQVATKKFIVKGMIIGDIYLDNCKKGKYFRIVCKVRAQDGSFLTDKLLEYKLGVKYYGGTKVTDWSKWPKNKRK